MLHLLTNYHPSHQPEGISFHKYPFQGMELESTHPDALLWYCPEVHQIPQGLLDLDLPTIAIVSDWNLNALQTIGALERFDLVLLDKRGTELAQKLGYSNVAEFNSYGLHTLNYPEPIETTEEYDVVFVGNVVPWVQKERGQWLRRLLKLSDQLKIRIETQVYGEDFRKLLRSAKVVFNHSIRGEANMRVFESLALDCMVFLEKENQEIERFLKPQESCFLYDNAQMEQALMTIVQDKERRDSIRMRAREEREKWSAAMRWKELRTIIARQISYAKRHRVPMEKHQVNDYAMRLMSPTVTSGNPSSEKQFETLLSSSMSSVGVWSALAGLSLQGVPTKGMLDVAKALMDGARKQKERLIWNLFHYAQILRKGRLVSEEVSIWNEMITLLDPLDPQMVKGFPVYNTPMARHSDIQMAVWNHVASGTFSEGPDLAEFLASWAYHRLGEIAQKEGDLPRAREYVQQSASLFAGHAPTWSLLSSLCEVSDPMRLMALEAAFEANPLDPNAGVQLLHALLDVPDPVRAKELHGELIHLLELQCKAYKTSEVEKAKVKEFSDQVGLILKEIQ